MALRRLSKTRRPHRRHDGCEVVVDEHQRGRLAGHVGATGAHGHAHVRRAQRRGVVHAIARRRDDVAAGLERLHDAQRIDYLRVAQAKPRVARSVRTPIDRHVAAQPAGAPQTVGAPDNPSDWTRVFCRRIDSAHAASG